MKIDNFFDRKVTSVNKESFNHKIFNSALNRRKNEQKKFMSSLFKSYAKFDSNYENKDNIRNFVKTHNATLVNKLFNLCKNLVDEPGIIFVIEEKEKKTCNFERIQRKNKSVKENSGKSVSSIILPEICLTERSKVKVSNSTGTSKVRVTDVLNTEPNNKNNVILFYKEINYQMQSSFVTMNNPILNSNKNIKYNNLRKKEK